MKRTERSEVEFLGSGVKRRRSGRYLEQAIFDSFPFRGITFNLAATTSFDCLLFRGKQLKEVVVLMAKSTVTTKLVNGIGNNCKFDFLNPLLF